MTKLPTPYTLTLTIQDRRAIDWIGHRYAHGDELYKCLWGECNQTPDDADWDDPRDITFHIPECVAWDIYDIIEEDDLACFADSLKDKLYNFMHSIV